MAMQSTMQNMLQTLLQLRQLKLQREQVEISRRNQQMGAQSGFQNMLQSMADPMTMMPFAGDFAQSTGMQQPAVETMIKQTPASVATTKSRLTQQGAGAVSPEQAALQNIVGQTESSNVQDKFMAKVFGQTGDYYSGLSPEEQQGFQKGVLQRITTGQDVGTAAMSEATADFMKKAPKNVKDQIIAVGKGLAPSASEDAQIQLGYARHRLDERQALSSAAMDDLRLRASVEEARNRLDANAFKETNDLLFKRSELIQYMVRNSTTMTPDGLNSFSQQLNAFNEQIRKMAPTIYGKGGTHELSDMKPKGAAGSTGILPFIQSWLSQPR